MKWPAFDYARARTLDEFWKLRAEGGPDAQVLAGGQSLLATLAFRLSQPSLLIDITGINALKGITQTPNGLRIGALTRHVDLERSPEIRAGAPLLAEAAPLIAHPAIRNRGTLGGSLALADPAAELPACMVALGATIIAASPEGERAIPARDFFLGLFETALRDDEIIVAVEVPRPHAGQQATILEITRRSGDYAMAGLAASVILKGGSVAEARLVYFGVDSVPAFAAGASAVLKGRALDATAIADAEAALSGDLDPPDDLHGPGEMKRHLCRVLTRRVLTSFLTGERAAA